MRYTRWEDVVARYPSAAGISTANDAQNFELSFGRPAEATVDASLGLRYTVPIANTPDLTPDVVRDVATDLAYWKMAWLKLDERQEKILRESIDKRLTALACGSMTLTDSSGLVSRPVRVWGTHKSYPNVSGVDPIPEWKVSSAQLQDQEDSRDA